MTTHSGVTMEKEVYLFTVGKLTNCYKKEKFKDCLKS